MTDLITFLDKNRKYDVYTEGDINVIQNYLEMIGAPTTLTDSVQCSHNFSPSYSKKNDTAYIQPVIAALRTIQKSIFECCGLIGHKYDA